MNKKIEEIKDRLKTLVPLNNDAFCLFAKSKKFCEEFLRVILEDEELLVIENEPQKFIPNAYYKGVYLDMLCKLKDGRMVNVEIQLYDEKESAKRIFYYASMIEQAFVDKGTKYEEIKDIIVIYLTKEDKFKKGSTIYNVKMEVVSDSNEYVEEWKPGLKVMYVNAVGLTNKTINEYLKLLTDKTTYNIKYPETTRIKESLIKVKGENMSKWLFDIMEGERQVGREEGMKQGMQQGMKQGMLSILISLVKEKVLTIKEAADRYSVSEAEFKKLMA